MGGCIGEWVGQWVGSGQITNLIKLELIDIVEYWIRLNETNSDIHMYTLIIYFIR